MKDYVFLNSNGTVHNLLHLADEDFISNHDDLKDLVYFDYTDWADEDKPRTQWTYNFESKTWNKVEPFIVSEMPEVLVKIEEPAADELAGGNK